MQLKRLSLIRFGIGTLMLSASLLVISSLGNVQASPAKQLMTAAVTVTPLHDDLMDIGFGSGTGASGDVTAAPLGQGSAECEALFNTYYQWLDHGARIRFFFVTNEYVVPNDDPTRSNVASYATGMLSYTEKGSKELSGTGTQYFNDRHLFDANSADNIQLSITPASIHLALLSWGGGQLNFTPPHCSNGALFALGDGNPNRNGANKVMYIFTFRRG